MPFTGPYPTTFSGITTQMVISTTTFSGGVTNAGTMGSGGIVVSGSSIGGALVDLGFISASTIGILVEDADISGGIVVASNGSIFSRQKSDISVVSAATFTGGIGNAGRISGLSDNGIVVSQVGQFGVGSSGSGIVNKGTISVGGGSGIFLRSIAAFDGGIGNSGRIIAPSGSGIHVDGITTFAGGISNSGTIAAKTTPFGSDQGINVLNVATFVGGVSNGVTGVISGNFGIDVASGGQFGGPSSAVAISNSGTIAANAAGIFVNEVGNLAGDIVNHGAIRAGVSGIAIQGVTIFSGSVINSSGGVIAVGDSAIRVSAFGVSTFIGAIVNGGIIKSSFLNAVVVQNDATVFGNILNSGKITASRSDIFVAHVLVFAGGIRNTGTLSARGEAGVEVQTVAVFGTSNAGGAIVNSGTISAPQGIVIETISTFSGLITNAGTISAVGNGISVRSVATLAGDIVNGGKITAGTRGILVSEVAAAGGSLGGGVTNIGTISAANTGIFLTAVTNFSGVANKGTISAAKIGIVLQTVAAFGVTGSGGGIVNSGTIIAKAT